jgi:serine/threonine protein kinase
VEEVRGQTGPTPPLSTPAKSADFGPRYRHGAPLGKGGMSEVVRVFDRARGEEVALKVLHSSSRAITLSAEFRYIASLNHPGVVSVYDFGLTADGRPYFTMELLGEGDLLDVAEKASLAATLRTAREVFRTLDFVHARGIVHGDLKPSNILLGKTRSGEHYPKLLDFGIAWTDAAEQHGGTAQFMAPELFRRTKERDHRSDLYSMGVVVYELFTGAVPFDDASVVNLARQHLQTPPPDPRDRSEPLPGELAERRTPPTASSTAARSSPPSTRSSPRARRGRPRATTSTRSPRPRCASPAARASSATRRSSSSSSSAPATSSAAARSCSCRARAASARRAS